MTSPDPAIPMLGDPAEITTPGARQFERKRHCPVSRAWLQKVLRAPARSGFTHYIVWVTEHDGLGITAGKPRHDGHRALLIAPESVRYFKSHTRARINICTCQGEFIE